MNTIEEIFNKQVTKEEIEKIAYIIFGIFIFLMPIIPEQIGFGIYSLRATMFNVVTVIMVLILCIINIGKFKLNIYDALAAIYLILVLVSTLNSSYSTLDCIFGLNGRGEGLLTIISYIATFIIFVKGYNHIKGILKFALIGATIVCIYSIIQANTLKTTSLFFSPSTEFGIAEGTMGNQNFLSSYICMFLPMMCYYYLNKKEHKSLILITLLFTSLIYAKTMSGYTTCAIVTVLILLFSLINIKTRKQVLIKFLIMLIVFTTVFIVINYFADGMYLNEIIEAKSEIIKLKNNDDTFGTGRMLIWKRVGVVIKDNFMWGIGPDCLAKELKKDEYLMLGDNDIFFKHKVDKAHCEYLHIAVTTGVPSLIVYLVLVLTILKSLIKKSLQSNKNSNTSEKTLFINMIIIAITSYLAQALGNISVVQVAPIFWAILGIGAGITIKEKIYIKRKK